MPNCDFENLKTISVIIPCYNEQATLGIVIEKLLATVQDSEIVIVDDGSKDGTVELIEGLAKQTSILPIYLPVNSGKGAAIRAAQESVSGQIVVIQDADSEYDPKDIPKLIKPILDGKADVVYGSRFHGESQRVHLFWHRVANWSLTLLSNALNNLNLSDMETGYKAFRTEVFQSLKLKETRFGIEPEITAKIARKKYRIYEVPISYSGRDYSEGKKIRFKDALRALYCIFRYRFFD